MLGAFRLEGHGVTQHFMFFDIAMNYRTKLPWQSLYPDSNTCFSFRNYCTILWFCDDINIHVVHLMFRCKHSHKSSCAKLGKLFPSIICYLQHIKHPCVSIEFTIAQEEYTCRKFAIKIYYQNETNLKHSSHV